MWDLATDIRTFKNVQRSNETLQIRNTFSGSTVFLTGSTGFLGKLLIEKLLRSCPDIKKLYMLARPKKNKSVTERLQEQFNDVVYDRLREECPDFIQKIKIVEGDVGILDLGVSDKHRREITEQAEFIFHGAATVRFDEAIKKATEINVRGVREMMELARNCKKLRAFVHISTAFSNCLEMNIDEKIYDVPLAPEKLIHLVENLDEDFLDKMSPLLVGNYPNTYAYTKSTAEHVVWSYAKGLPVAIFRPSIVISTAKEPVPGWIDNVYGPTGVVAGAGVGLIRVMNADKSAVADLVPADMVVNTCIAIAWKTAKDYPRFEEHAFDQNPLIYNYVSSIEKPITWKQFMDYTEAYGLSIPPKAAVWYYMFFLTRNKYMYNISSYLLHWLPAYIIDAAAVVLGKKPVLKKAYSKIDKYMAVISYFATRQWKFTNENIQNLYKELCEDDKKVYNFNMASIRWDVYFQNYVHGVRSYIVKETLDTVPEAIKKLKIQRILHYMLITISILTKSWIIYCIFWKLF